MGKVSKSTKKFQAKHLKKTLDQRKKVQSHKQKLGQYKTNKGRKPAAETEEEEGDKNEVFQDMDVEDFFDGGFEVPKEKKSKKSKATKEEVVEEEEEESESESEPEIDSESEDDEEEEEKSKKDKKEDEEDEESDDDEEFESHKQALDDLSKEDPDFYKYLKENDRDLLDFEAVNPLDAISDDDEDDEEDEVAASKKDEDKDDMKNTIEVTIELAKTWEQNVKSENPSLKSLRNLISAFKAAVNVSSDNTYRYAVTDEKVFNRLMIIVLQLFPRAIQKLTPYKISHSGVRSLPNNKKVAQIQSILKLHAGSLITLLQDITNTGTAVLVLSSIQELSPYYISARKLIKSLLEAIVTVWSTTKDVETQVASFAFLNNITKEYPKGCLELVLKLTYSTFIKKCRHTNIHTMPMINFQKNSAAELYSIDSNLGYQVGFEFIRQLAIHLRSSVNNPTKESYKTIYNWQYCHSLDFWSRVLALNCSPEKEIELKKESPLRQLIYPLVQVTLGAIRLIPTAQFFPLRFYLIKSLIRISQSTGVFIPIFPLLSEILNSTAITKTPKRSTLPAVDFDNTIRVNQAYLGTRVFQEGICEQFIDLAGEFFVLHCKSIAFPELSTPAIIYLRRYIKTSKNAKFNKQISNLVEKLSKNSQFITTKRSSVEFGPNNKIDAINFLKDLEWQKTPLGAFVQTQRDVAEAKAKLLRESLLEEEEAKNKKNNDDEDEDLDMVDDEDEDDEEGAENDEEEEDDE